MYKLYHGDCLDVMQSIPDNSIDCVICDLPYGTTSCQWDTVIDMENLWNQYNRITKDTSTIILFGSQPFTSKLIISNIDNFRESLVWVKNRSSSGILSKSRHMKVHEDIIVFSRTGSYTFNPILWSVPEDFIIKRNVNEILSEKNNIIGTANSGRVRKLDDGTRSPISVLPYKVPYSPKRSSSKRDGDVRFHPTQKPIALIEYLVCTYANIGDCVLDNCMGSGTTGVACLRNDRNFIGIELDEEYFKIAQDRIYQEEKQLKSKLF